MHRGCFRLRSSLHGDQSVVVGNWLRVVAFVALFHIVRRHYAFIDFLEQLREIFVEEI